MISNWSFNFISKGESASVNPSGYGAALEPWPCPDGRANPSLLLLWLKEHLQEHRGCASLPFQGRPAYCLYRRLAPAAIHTNSWSGAKPPEPPIPPAPKGELRKGEHMRKERMFAMRMSKLDYDCIQHKAEQAGMSMTAFITASALDKNITVVDGLDKVLAELKAIGKNLNQLTILCNMGRITCLDLTEIKSSFGTVFDYLYNRME